MPRGTLYFIVGPSGAGKDALIERVRSRRPDLYLMPRTITRPAIADEHVEVTEEEFATLKRRYAFCLSWDANGLRYGISRDLETRLEAGQSVILNGSRGIVDEVTEQFQPSRIIYVHARLDILAHRLRSRGREDENEIELRLARAERAAPKGPNVIAVDNSDSLDDSSEVFLAAMN